MKVINITILLLLFALPVFAEDICFDDQTAKKLVVELEECRVIKEQVKLYQETDTNLAEQINLCEEKNTKYNTQLTLERENCVKEVKAAKPSFTEKAGLFGLGGLTGAGVILFLLILL